MSGAPTSTGSTTPTGSSDFHGPDHSRCWRWRAFELHGCEPRLGPIGG